LKYESFNLDNAVFRWIFRECELSISSPEGNFKVPEIYDETYSDITGKTWKYSTAWSQ